MFPVEREMWIEPFKHRAGAWYLVDVYTITSGCYSSYRVTIQHPTDIHAIDSEDDVPT